MIKIQNTNQFIVRVDGQLDEDWMNRIHAEERREAIAVAGREALDATIAYSIDVGKRAGMLALNVLDELVSSAKR